MLKQIAEVGLGVLALYSVRKPVLETFKRASESKDPLDAFARGGATGSMCVGAVLAAPISAPVGAIMLGRDAWQHRAEIKTFVKDLPSNVRAVPHFVKDVYDHLLGRRDVLTSEPSAFAAAVAAELEPSRDYVVG